MSLTGASSRHRMRWFRISSVPVRDHRAGWYHHPPGRWLWLRLAAYSQRSFGTASVGRVSSAQNPTGSASPCGWHRPAATQSTALASDRRKPLVCPISLSSTTLDSLKNRTPGGLLAADTPRQSGAGVTLEGLLKAEDADQGRGYRLGTGG